ncbi:MAG: transketolase family protein [Alphaproteobacteria bacterium]|nr:transketolase family protein [Alphaproteobacteria bacterium]MDE1985446.1 transketolase family protein [Alphaproteobacteria bacterium]MDE2161539.1 transketolase family protein [Alphaproteobacteria bacterium]MDE2500794.1 transketolase family protein [Alphaproteobacteria bacterium]
MSDNNAPALIGTSGDSLREAFGKALTNLADEFPKLVVLDADVAGGTGVHHFRKAHPDKFIQFGIAEQNMVAAAGGLAAVGMLPVVTGFAVFLSRAFEQTRLSIAYCKRNAKIVASHPGLDVGPDGGSAQALEDIAAFRAIPGMTVISPADPKEMELATRAMLEFEGPVYMRTGRSAAKRLFGDDHTFEIGKGQILRNGRDVTLVACGVEVARALEAAELLETDGIDARVVNMATIKPIDAKLLKQCAAETGCMVTAEDHNIYGGLGSAVAEAVTQGHPCPIEFVGLNDTFGSSGEPDELAAHYQITAPFIAEAARRAIARKGSLQ